MSLAVKVARAGSQGGIGAGRLSQSGDPGLFGFLGKLGRGVLKALPGGNIIDQFLPRGQVQRNAPPSAPIPLRVASPGISAPAPGIRAVFERGIPGGATGLVPAGCPSGFHPNKSAYSLLDGSRVEKGTRCVRNRRRNSLNPRALDRAMGRITSAKKASKKLGRITIRDKK